MFSPAVPRSTSIVLAKSLTGQYCLVTSASTRPSTEVILIDPGTGLLIKDKDKYTDEASALNVLGARGYEVCLRGCALLGYVAAGGTAGVLIATRVRNKCTLPGGHAVFLVVDSQWVLMPLQNGVSADPAAAALDASFWSVLQQYTLNNAHYYCDTADLSRPFPSDAAPGSPNPEFVWNAWLAEPLRALGLRDVCPTLLQGAVECSTEVHPSGERYSIALLSRRSRLHPGTRYLARGLNQRAGPGNEIECELIMWTHPMAQEEAAGAAGEALAEPLQWARVVWRRGTVPIWWGVNLQSLQKGLQAEVYVKEHEPYKGTVTYFRSLQRQHIQDPQVEAALAGDWTLLENGSSSSGQEGASGEEAQRAEQQQQQQQQGAQQGPKQAAQQAGQQGSVQDASLGVPVTCVNLLHANPKKASELMLSEHFHEAVRFVRKRLGGSVPLKVVNFDWHGNMGKLSEEKGIEGFWSFVDPVLRQCGVASGTMEPASSAGGQAKGDSSNGAPAAAAADGPLTPWGPRWRMRWRQQQHGIVRFNCADSLDRTNAATCFAMLPALQEGLRLLGIPLDVGGLSPGAAAMLRGRLPSRSATASSSGADLGSLAAGSAAAASPPSGGLSVSRAESEAVREAGQGAYQGQQAYQQELPPGWDVVSHQGRPLYVDHINKRTQWHPPVMPKPTPSRAGAFIASAAEMFSRLQRQSSPPRMGGGSGMGDASGHSSRNSSFTNLSGTTESPPQGSRLLASPSASPAAGAVGSPGAAGAAGIEGGGLSTEKRSKSFSHLIAHVGGAFRSTPELRGGGGGGGAGQRPSPASGAVEQASSDSPRTDEQDRSTGGAAPASPPSGPWGFFSIGGVAEVRERLYKEAVADYVEMFKVHGDIHSFLYTGSPAMHSHVLGLVVQGGKTYGASSGVGKLQNLRVAVQRRWNNTMSDASRQQAVELFLGLHLNKHFRGLETLYPPPPPEAEFGTLDPADLEPIGDEQLHKSTELRDLPIQIHHGMLAVKQDLMDLEPFAEDDAEVGSAAKELLVGSSRAVNGGCSTGDEGSSPLVGTAVAQEEGASGERERGRGRGGAGEGRQQAVGGLASGAGPEGDAGNAGGDGSDGDLITFEGAVGAGQQQQQGRGVGGAAAAAAQLQDLLL